mmetsp:Transcript_20324/g.29841  ORF Transcript_20324/g.29841 Transcript_20324/m.29841 type:complete len:86 (-) Transcript_20324:295-552(-)
MFQLLRSFTGLQEEGGDAPAADHYLYFRGIPNPPDDYLPPTGASPNTWPAIYNNLQNIDYCTTAFAHIGSRIKCMKAFNPGPMLP